MDTDLLGNFFYFVGERWQIHLRKDTMEFPPPWTSDPILRQYRFCNVHREDDRVSRWIAENWRTPMEYSPYLVEAMLLARIVNWPDSLAEIGVPWHGWTLEYRGQFLKIMEARMKRGLKSWTSAYMVTGTESRGMKKSDYCALIMDRYKERGTIRSSSRLDFVSAALQQVKGISGFLAGQVVADVKYAKPWREITVDWHTFAEPGPGSIRGLHRLHKRNYNGGMGRQQFLEELNALREAYMNANLQHCPPVPHNQDLQNCLCEWDKYRRAVEGQGAPKQIYVPSTVKV